MHSSLIQQTGSRTDKKSHIIFFLLSVCCVAAPTLWNLYHRIYPNEIQRRSFFTAQADRILDGELSVHSSFLGGECFITEIPDMCQGYFGITPSVIRIPVVFFLNDPSLQLTLYSWTLALSALLFGSWIWVFNILPARRHTFILWIIIGSFFYSVTFLSARPMIYEEVIFWGLSLSVLSTALAVRAFQTGNKLFLLGATVASIGAINARPTIGSIPFVFLFLLGFFQVLRTKNEFFCKFQSFSISTFITYAAAALSGPATYLWINTVKFDSISPQFERHANLMNDPFQLQYFSDTRFVNIKTIPTKIWETFSLPGAKFGGQFPWVNFKSRIIESRWPASKSSLDVFPIGESTSLWIFATPVVVIFIISLLVIAFKLIEKGKNKTISDKEKSILDVPGQVAISIVLASAFALLLSFSFPGFTSRYVFDALPFFVVSSILLSGRLFDNFSNRLRKSFLVCLLVALVAQVILLSLGTHEFGCSVGGEQNPPADPCLIF